MKQSSAIFACVLTGLSLGLVPHLAAQSTPGNGATILTGPGQSEVLTSMAPGETRQVSILVRNTGSSTWKSEADVTFPFGPGNYPYRLGTTRPAGEANELVWSFFNCPSPRPAGGYSNSLTDQRVYRCSGSVAPGQEVRFTFMITAPSSASGTLHLTLGMVEETGLASDLGWFGDFTRWDIAVTPAAPHPPFLNATPEDGRVTLDWTQTAGAGGSYNLKRGPSPGNYTAAAINATSPYIDSSVVNGNNYCYAAIAVNASGVESGNSNERCVTPTAGTPSAPDPPQLSATPGDGRVTLDWTQTAGAGGRYNLKRGPSPGNYTATATNATSPYIDSSVVNGNNYCYVAIAVNASGVESGNSNERCVTPTAGAPSAPDPPQLSATPGDGRVALDWTQTAGPGGTYTLRRGSSPGSYDTTIANASSPYVDSPVTNGNNYCYVAVAINSSGVASGNSDERCVTPLGPSPSVPDPPNLEDPIPGVLQLTLRWSPVSGATAYNLRRRLASAASYTLIQNVTSPYLDAGLAVDTYCYVATALNGVGESTFSAERCATALPPEPGLSLELAELSGDLLGDGQTLTTNGDGWIEQNPIRVTATLSCPAGLPSGCRGDAFRLQVRSDSATARFYMEAGVAASCSNDGPLSQAVFPYSLRSTTWLCIESGSTGVELGPGESRTMSWYLMAHPTGAADVLRLEATWASASQSRRLGIPDSRIHPVILIPGILGTMPPSPVIGQMDPVLGVYDSLIVNLQKMGYVLGGTLVPMPYDWRRSNRESAGHLAEHIDSVLSFARNFSGVNFDGKVDLVVHSMGGLVTRVYVEGMGIDGSGQALGYRDDIRKVVFMATPHRGFPEDYETYEGTNWDNFLYQETAARYAMDYVFWPAFVEKRWRKRHTAYLDYLPHTEPGLQNGRVLCVLNPFDCLNITYRMAHDTVGGADSLREMLPTDDVDTDPSTWPYLCDTAPGAVCTGRYPWGKQTNPLLNVLNAPANLGLLTTRLGVSNMYVIFGTDPLPSNYADVFYDVGAPVRNLAGNIVAWANGAPQQNFTTSQGDDLIPAYSMNLRLLVPGIPEENVAGPVSATGKTFGIAGEGARHLPIMRNDDVERVYLPRFLAGLDRVPFTTPYSKPVFLLDPDQWFTLLALCPVNLTITDPDGRRAGFDPAGGVFNEIPNAVYAAPGSPDGQFIILPKPAAAGLYKITATGFDSDSFALSLSQVTRKGVFVRWRTGGETVPGKVDEFTVEIDPTLPAQQTPPVADAGPEQTVAADPSCKANVTLDGSGSSDAEGEVLSYIWTGPFGAAEGASPTVTLPKGRHSVSLIVKDAQGSSTDSTFVTVRDVTPPAFENVPGPIRAEQTSRNGTPVQVPLPVAVDNCDAGLRVTSDAPAVFPLGVTRVTFTARDTSGNVGRATTTVTIVDTKAPVIRSLSASPNVLWPPNHKMVPVTLAASVTDVCDAAPRCRITSVSSNEPENGSGDGSTSPDGEITGDLTLKLRAERAGNGKGRIYTVAVTCTDASGNSSRKTVTVAVPHDRGH